MITVKSVPAAAAVQMTEVNAVPFRRKRQKTKEKSRHLSGPLMRSTESSTFSRTVDTAPNKTKLRISSNVQKTCPKTAKHCPLCDYPLQRRNTCKTLGASQRPAVSSPLTTSYICRRTISDGTTCLKFIGGWNNTIFDHFSTHQLLKHLP